MIGHKRWKVTVRGKEVDFSDQAINALFELPEVVDDAYTDLLKSEYDIAVVNEVTSVRQPLP